MGRRNRAKGRLVLEFANTIPMFVSKLLPIENLLLLTRYGTGPLLPQVYTSLLALVL
jgi:hypothetical protein